MPDPPASHTKSSSAWSERRDVFRSVDWHTYSQLSQSLHEGQHLRLIYDGNDLEIMVTGNIHEILKELINKILTAAAMSLDVDFVACGQTRWKSSTRGLEADLSYYFEPEKIRAAREAAGRKSEAPTDYPRPDLAVEIDISPPQVDRRSGASSRVRSSSSSNSKATAPTPSSSGAGLFRSPPTLCFSG